MGQDRRPLVITGQPPLPLLNQYTYVLDSTMRLIEPIVVSAARKVPGKYRHQWAGGRVRGTLKNGSQTVTVNLLLLTGRVGTNADWEIDATADSAGVISVTNGTTKVFDWLPRSSDFAVEVLAGGTATDGLGAEFSITWDPSPAV